MRKVAHEILIDLITLNNFTCFLKNNIWSLLITKTKLGEHERGHFHFWEARF